MAMMIQTGVLEREETAMATDFGTNAEVALFHDGAIFTGSTAAGPALEGQQITCGMLAVPGAVSDLEPAEDYHRLVVLDREMFPVPGSVVDLREKRSMGEADGTRPIGITGTGVIALISQAMEAGLIALPRINTPDGRLHLGRDIFLTEGDLREAGKAIGAVRAGHITLCCEAGITPADIRIAYMSGASGTYVDAIKAQKLGMIPPCLERVYQVGNTSLAMAGDLACKPKTLNMMADLGDRLKKSHCMFAASKIFQKIFILELSHWNEGMPMTQYRRFMNKYGLPNLPQVSGRPEVIRTVKRDINDLGKMGLTIITDIGRKIGLQVEGCDSCKQCVRECPEKAISMKADTDPITLILDESLCNGVACRRCERVCPEKVFQLDRFFRHASAGHDARPGTSPCRYSE
jgi:methylamine methyltransferase corrinoid protein reductive activase